ncbi:terminase large subunit [Marinomonas phage P12026]|uniref:terminase large subunit n=1 Tax=Marinomonas phage P12026 TaxID=1176423 RepID=UPI0002688F2C|nr:terminase large subunit [Marinomonas phage P12026]AFM54848.1 phage terminase large subunit [Marinomonas phage P12026]
MTVAQIELPPKLIPVFSEPYRRIRGAYGGRGSGKTFSFALMSAIRAYMAAESGQKGVILCAREWMNSLKDSSMAEVKGAIESVDWLKNYFDIGQEYIRTKNGNVEYIFTGLNRNLDSLKSKARILIAWVDEAEGVSSMAWDKLEPTVRTEGSEIWVTWNPELDGSTTDLRFRKQLDELEGNSMIVEMNYGDNPWFPQVLEDLRKRQQRTLDPNTYAWIWEGAYRQNSDAQVFANKYRIDSFEPKDHWDGPYHGLDFGFSQDPTAAVKCWIDGDRLMIEREAGKVGLELDDTAIFIEQEIPEISRHVVRADCARPESVSHLRRHGLPQVTSTSKWAGSVEDGIQFMRSFSEIVIHERCIEIQKEFRLYSYKVDKNSGDVLTTIVDKHNHYIDAIRYALNPMIKKEEFIFEV